MDVQTDEDGFLLDPEDWTEEIAKKIAVKEELELTEDRWNLIRLIREYYYENHSVPELRKILKQLKAELGPEKATRKYVYALFPYGYGQQGCKIAGMRQPKKLWLDL
ncbi:MAG: TusE/DsrC/DsvC family sulfur relay protein [Gammaproteobacteria bacterium]|nr:MAG: TusE/DsrC/DsvC family sulfur relay protein [Gammaproteobacteria bacterium]